VLDLCAAPGGKSIQLADQKAGLLISNELNPIRRKALKANLERCGIWNTIVTGYDGRVLGNLLYEQCDKVLLDAPCSGEGMQYKSDVTIYQRNEKVIRKLAHMQYELLIAGLTALKI
jgi:16S rRNA (cytosine1407-C5)-methyltransferase